MTDAVWVSVTSLGGVALGGGLSVHGRFIEASQDVEREAVE